MDVLLSLFFFCCCVLCSLCDELITRSGESYRLNVCVCLCLIERGLETSTMRRPYFGVGCCDIENILCLWFRASLIYINNCLTRCNTKQSLYYSTSSLYMFRVSTTPIFRSTQNCNYSLRYCSYLPQTWPS